MNAEIGLKNGKQMLWLVLGVAAALFILSQFQVTRNLTGLTGRGALPAVGG